MESPICSHFRAEASRSTCRLRFNRRAVLSARPARGRAPRLRWLSSPAIRDVTPTLVHATVTIMSGLDLESIGRSVVKLRADVPEDAFTAGVLGGARPGDGGLLHCKWFILILGSPG